MKQALGVPQAIPPAQLEVAPLWAESIRNQKIYEQGELQVEGRFAHSILETVPNFPLTALHIRFTNPG
jgi:hypothetical protein